MNKDDPKYWEEKILPWIQELKAKQEEARKLLLELEAAAYHKAGYTKVSGRYIHLKDKMTLKQMSELTNEQWKERRTV